MARSAEAILGVSVWLCRVKLFVNPVSLKDGEFRWTVLYLLIGASCLWVQVFTEYTAIVVLKYSSAPDAFGDRGDTPRWGPMAGSAACCTPYIRCCPFFPYTDTANGAAGHNRGVVAETPPLARTHGRTVGCILNFSFVGPFKMCLLRVLRPCNGEDPKNVERLLIRQSRLGVYTLFRRHRVMEPSAGKPGKLVG